MQITSAKLGNNHDNPQITPIGKICMGDVVKITTKNKTLVNSSGTVMYIGRPYPGCGVRYGINLSSSAKGTHDGSILFDIKTEKICDPKHYKKYHKRIKKRTFFNANKNHGIFVRKDEIKVIERQSTLATRFTIEDFVEVRFRGMGQIQFVGPLEHTKKMGFWYGIKLKERKGRHNGSVNGVKYFECGAQYGLHCRVNHLTLIESKQAKTNKITKTEIANKPQASGKLAAILNNGTMKKGFSSKKKKDKFVSAKNLGPMSYLQFDSNPLDLQPPPALHITFTRSTTPLNLATPSNLIETQSQLSQIHEEQTSLANILPQSIFEHGLSVHILPGMHQRASKSSVYKKPPSSVKRGGTINVLPGFVKERKFFDHFDFDEIEDELGDGEFGVVYRCKRVYEEDDDEWEYSKTFEPRSPSYSGSEVQYPGGDSGSDSDSDTALYPGSSNSGSDTDNDDGKKNEDDEVFAVKKIKKAKFHHLNYQNKQDNIKLLQQEIKLLEKIQRLKKKKMEGSQYVIDLEDAFEDRNYLYIVTSYCDGGNLWQYIDQAVENDEMHSEKGIQRIMKQILEGIAFLHRHNVAHLDLKPDNIMFSAGTNQIQLIDFGMSRMIPPLHKAGMLVGTSNFVAPEVIDGFYDRKADIWSIGVIFFMLRFGYPPFFIGNNTSHETMNGTAISENKQLFNLIQKGFDPVVKSGLGPWFNVDIVVSDSLKDLIGKMLDKDLAKRLTAAECLTHPYFKQLADSKKLAPTIMDALTKFRGQCQFTVMMSRLFAHQIGADQMKQLQEIWNKFDVDGNGTVTFKQFKQVMNEYDHGYKDYQIEAIFESLDWNETDTINFNSLLTAFSYQRLVAVDERLWEAFARLDVDNDGHITKAEIKRVLAMVNPDEFDDGLNKLDEFRPPPEIEVEINPTNDKNHKLSGAERRKKNISIWIGECMISADWDDDGQIDYEEFLRALHPRFNEQPVTPKGFRQTTTDVDAATPKFIFQPSLETAGFGSNTKTDETKKKEYDKYVNEFKTEQ